MTRRVTIRVEADALLERAERERDAARAQCDAFAKALLDTLIRNGMSPTYAAALIDEALAKLEDK